MKRQIRRGVFETNSSSMHSLVIMKHGRHYTDSEMNDNNYIREDGLWNIGEYEGLYYGRRPFDILVTFNDKLKYVIASMVNHEDDDIMKELKRICRQYVHGYWYWDGEEHDSPFKDFEFPTRRIPAYQDEDGNYYNEYDDDIKYKGYEDHHAVYTTSNGKALKEDKAVYYEAPDYGYAESCLVPTLLQRYNITLEEFLLNNRYIVIIDGDEYNDFERFCKSKIINIDEIESIISANGDWAFDDDRLKQKVINKEYV